MTDKTCIIEKEPFDECGENLADDIADQEEVSGGDGNTSSSSTSDDFDCFAGICVEVRDGVLCPVDNFRSPFELAGTSDSCIQDGFIEDQLNISGADVNVYKLLGIHEQGKLVDLTGDGTAISNGDHPNFPAKNAFDLFNTEWRSLQIGQDVVNSAFIGYDFGEIRLDNDRLRYGIETFVKHNISKIKIKQTCNSNTKATKIRLERSHDGVRWFGVGVSSVKECDGLVTIDFKSSVPSRYWRIRPIEFNGSNTDYWSVQALQFIEHETTHIDNVQDKIFMENRDRDYADIPIKLKGSYSPFDSQSFFSKFGIGNNLGGEQYSIELSWSSVIRLLGRPLVIGDILQLPSETQYSASITPVLKYLMVTDVDWSPNGYSPQWIPLITRVIAVPAIASIETQDIFGKLTEDYDEMGLADTGDGVNNKKYQDISDVDHTIRATSNTEVPQRGEDVSNVQKFSKELYQWEEENLDANMKRYDRPRNFWSQDGMPPNGEPFTQGDEFPPTPKDRDYHRLTYTKIRQGIPPRLYRYSEDKGTWIFLETDRRAYNSVIRRRLQEFSDPESSTVTRPDEIDEEFMK